MKPELLLGLFLIIRFGQHFFESMLARANYRFYSDPAKQEEAQKTLGISAEDMSKSFAYSRDKFHFQTLSGWLSLISTLIFLGLGGLGFIETIAQALNFFLGNTALGVGLIFFACAGFLSFLLSLPFEYYSTFVIEEKHGFNRQTLRGFVLDRCKGMLLGVVLGGCVLSILLTIIEKAGDQWWILAWLTIFGFSLVTAWIYPMLLAPIFNKFSPVEDGDLKDCLFELANKVNFQAESISVMNASIRSTHGNAYFTGVFGKKRIVLFDTLIKTLNSQEIVAVLAHELGHFKLHHVRWGLIRSFFSTGLMFYFFFLCSQWPELYSAFHFSSASNYGALVIFSLLLSPLSFLLQPIGTFLSRKNEFAADAFAAQNISQKEDLIQALLKLRQQSQSMPICHPLFSTFYHSHPPLLERIKAMGSL